jgi:hypothetical protein
MSRTSLGRLGLMFVSLLGLMALFSASALAAGKPVVTASAATNKSLNTATSNGTVNPNGASTTYKFEYGKTALYGKSTTVTSAGSGSTPVAVNAIITGLEPLTTYHYRVSATNSFGTTVSEDVIFEMLLSWKIEGKVPSAYANKGQYATVNPTWTLAVEGTTGGGTAVKITCAPDYFGSWATGHLGSDYHFSFTGCKTFLNGVESKNCTPKAPFVLDLDAVLVPTKVKALELGELCAIGEEISIANGFAIGAMPEAKEQAITLTQVSPFQNMVVTLSNQTWKEVGETEGLKFGIS